MFEQNNGLENSYPNTF